MKQTFEYLESFAVMSLMMMGLTGAAFHLFRDGGLVESAGNGLWTFITDSPLMALALFICSVILTWMWKRSRSFQRQNSKTATAAFYVMLASGAYFLGRLIISGSV